MNSKYVYIIALVLLPLLRTVVLDMPSEVLFNSLHWGGATNAVLFLRSSPLFITYVGNWALPVFVACVFLFWLKESGEADIPKHFLLLPIVYVPFSITGTVLKTTEFHFSYLYVQPLVILPFGFLYVAVWVLLVWLLTKATLVQ